MCLIKCDGSGAVALMLRLETGTLACFPAGTGCLNGAVSEVRMLWIGCSFCDKIAVKDLTPFPQRTRARTRTIGNASGVESYEGSTVCMENILPGA